MTDDDTVAAARAAFARAAGRLAAEGGRVEAVAEFVPARRVLGIQRKAAMRPLGHAWHLGVLLLQPDLVVRAVGGITRAVEPGHPGHVALSIEDRRDHRAAAFRGPFERGATVHYDAAVVPLDADALRASDGPLLLRDGRVLVVWSAAIGAAGARDLEPYLDERVELLLHPPQGAT
ncbi:hypothetical protein QDR37_09820 [Amnibacterium sp. CER49]|uniref:hypothetical protein n=1 Tax=Amnibacterium sp. CER49 TaxID=3039161 RepID=UPI00244C5EDD|nr:hypothetical protein [Amnibacterium sp. CER49]MDH2444241.1 hypothetical protein [Amnibacterium sp. CER49]